MQMQTSMYSITYSNVWFGGQIVEVNEHGKIRCGVSLVAYNIVFSNKQIDILNISLTNTTKYFPRLATLSMIIIISCKEYD